MKAITIIIILTVLARLWITSVYWYMAGSERRRPSVRLAISQQLLLTAVIILLLWVHNETTFYIAIAGFGVYFLLGFIYRAQLRKEMRAASGAEAAG